MKIIIDYIEDTAIIEVRKFTHRPQNEFEYYEHAMEHSYFDEIDDDEPDYADGEYNDQD